MMANVVYYEYGLLVVTDDECARIGRDLGDKHLMIMNNHGLLACGRTVGEAFFLMYTLENACKVQVDALASGQELHLPEETAANTLSRFGKVGDAPNRSANMSWAAALRSLDAIDQSYKD